MRYLIALALLLPILGFSQQKTQIAFLADVHFQDLFGEFEDHDFKGIPLPNSSKTAILRTMDSQLRSTRIFNENYYAFLAALEDVAQKGIKIVAMPGDYTDDGQAYNLRGLQKVLEQYSQKYGMQFFLTTGNHDPVGPFWQQGGKSDFLNANGKPLEITSLPKPGAIVTQDMAMAGYETAHQYLKNFGFNPQPSYLYWSTPFDTEKVENYAYSKALNQASIAKRSYEVIPGFQVPDLSYVVEPLPNLWILAIDGNTYIPKNKAGEPMDPKNYNGSSVGYNDVLTHKTHLITWVKKITEEAQRLGKIVVPFTHYPMVEYNDNASEEIGELLGKTKWQLHREPRLEVAQLFADAGIKVHFGGHMHVNDTGIKRLPNGKTLINIQVPSLAAYVPAYKILSLHSPTHWEIETILIDKVPHFNELFPLYEKEYEQLPPEKRWNKDILKTTTYKQFTEFHLKELVRLRFMGSDWPKDFLDKAQNLNGKDFARMAKLKKSDFNWDFFTLITDLYKVQNADELAFTDIPKTRRKTYAALYKGLSKTNNTDRFTQQCQLLFTIWQKISNGEPCNHFSIDLNTTQIRKIK